MGAAIVSNHQLLGQLSCQKSKFNTRKIIFKVTKLFLKNTTLKKIEEFCLNYILTYLKARLICLVLQIFADQKMYEKKTHSAGTPSVYSHVTTRSTANLRLSRSIKSLHVPWYRKPIITESVFFDVQRAALAISIFSLVQFSQDALGFDCFQLSFSYCRFLPLSRGSLMCIATRWRRPDRPITDTTSCPTSLFTLGIELVSLWESFRQEKKTWKFCFSSQRSGDVCGLFRHNRVARFRDQHHAYHSPTKGIKAITIQ